MMNYAWDFNQSEAEKYFECIIICFIQKRSVTSHYRGSKISGSQQFFLKEMTI